jgi:hypothetical protein
MLERLPYPKIANAFLARILAPDGYKAAFVLPEKHHEWFDNTDQLADYLLHQDQLGKTVYHACASFKTAGKRTKTNVLGARALWLDIDAGEGKPYPSAVEVWKACEQFRSAIGLPAPTYVASGKGLHVWWPLGAMVPPEEWIVYARGLKAACAANGLHIDPVRVADIASILRTPGSHNRKHGEIEIVCGDLTGPYNIELFEQLNGIALSPSASSHRPLLHAARQIYSDEPSNPQSIAQACEQISALRDRSGKLPEPLWRAAVQILGWCGDEGRKLAHEWSKPDPRYTWEATEDRLNRRLDAPLTCAHFESINSNGCEGCAWKGRVTTPVQLGRRTVKPVISGQDNLTGDTKIIPARNSSGDPELDAQITRLARLPPLMCERERKVVAERFGLRTTILDKLINAERWQGEDNRQGRALDLTSPELWPVPVDGSELLSEISALLTRYVVMSRPAADAAALWVLHSHLIEAADTTPRLAIKSPEKRCGKTTLLTIISLLAPRVLATSNISPAALFRTVEAAKPTLLIDEADTFIAMSDELRGIINSGHTRATAYVVRTEGEDLQPRKFSTWAPIAFATIGKLPGTVEDRSIAIPLRRKRPDEKVERLRRNHTDHLRDVALRAARWAADQASGISDADPEIPEELHDRAADNWRPLFAIADGARGGWADRARIAALKLSAEGAADQDSMRTMLLADIRAAFRVKRADRLSSDELVGHLTGLDERPWPEMNKGKPVTKNGLARLLRPFDISSGTIRLAGEHTAKGYYVSAFDDAFARYLTPEKRHNVTTSDLWGFLRCSETSQAGSCDVFKTQRNPGFMQVVTL